MSLHPGLNIITGESGSGKSVLLEAIAQLSGAPAREEAIFQWGRVRRAEGLFVIGEDKGLAQVSTVLEKYIKVMPPRFVSVRRQVWGKQDL